MIRNALLVDLANEGDSAKDMVDEKVAALLARPPGAWLPDGFEAGYQMLDQAIKEASKVGKQVLFKSARRLLNELGRTWTYQKLTAEQGRQFLGSAMLIASHPKLLPENNMDLAVPLQLARAVPGLFWSRVPVPEEIVGSLPQQREQMLNYLWDRLPNGVRKLIQAAEAKSRANDNAETELLATAPIARSKKKSPTSDLLTVKAISERRPVLIELHYQPGNEPRMLWILFQRITALGSSATISESLAELVVPHGAVGHQMAVPLLNPSEATIINAIRTRIAIMRHQFLGQSGKVGWPQYTEIKPAAVMQCILGLAAF